MLQLRKARQSRFVFPISHFFKFLSVIIDYAKVTETFPGTTLEITKRYIIHLDQKSLYSLAYSQTTFYSVCFLSYLHTREKNSSLVPSA